MKLKELHSLLSDVRVFGEPKVELEQYPTGAHIASRMLYTIESMYHDFGGKIVLDLGCGTGMLAIGAALLGSSHVLGVDIDLDALELAQQNCDDFDDPLPVELLLCDVARLAAQRRLCADTVIMNPPFGTKRRGADMDFMRAAAALCTGAIYSLHKSSTREYIRKAATRELGLAEAEVLVQLRYDLPPTYKFHKLKSLDIEVDLWRFRVGAAAAARQQPTRLVAAPGPPGAGEDEDEKSNGSDNA